MHDKQVAKGTYNPAAHLRAAADVTPAETRALIPDINDPYEAAGFAESGELGRLVLVMGKAGFRAGGTAYYFLQYVHISMGEFGFWNDGQWFNFIWSDIQTKLVTVHGNDLLRIADYISLRRLPWIRLADRDFRVAGARSAEPVITRIEVTDWVRPEPQLEKPARALAAFEEA